MWFNGNGRQLPPQDDDLKNATAEYQKVVALISEKAELSKKDTVKLLRRVKKTFAALERAEKNGQ